MIHNEHITNCKLTYWQLDLFAGAIEAIAIKRNEMKWNAISPPPFTSFHFIYCGDKVEPCHTKSMSVSSIEWYIVGPIEFNSNGIENKLCHWTHKTCGNISRRTRQKTIEKKIFFSISIYWLLRSALGATVLGTFFFCQFSCRNWSYCNSRTFHFTRDAMASYFCCRLTQFSF